MAAACVRRKALHLSIIVEDARVSPSARSTSPRGDQCAQTAFKGRLDFKRAPEQQQIFSGCTRVLPRGAGASCVIRMKTCIVVVTPRITKSPPPPIIIIIIKNTRTRTQSSSVARLAIRPMV